MDVARDTDVRGRSGSGEGGARDHPKRAMVTAVSLGSAISKGAEIEAGSALGEKPDASSGNIILSCNFRVVMTLYSVCA